MRGITALVAIVVIVVIVAGAVYFVSQPPAQQKIELRLALILNGYKDWPGWYNEAYQASLYVKEKYGIDVVYAEDVQFGDQERVLNEVAAEGYDLIWGHSGAFDFTMPPVAEKYPNTYFFITGGRFEGLPNVISIDQAWRDPIFLTGALAASVSQSNIVGYQIGEPYPTVLDELNAFTIGAKYVKPNITVLSSILGNWSDIEASKEAALGMIAQGADFVAGWTGLADRGIATAAQERGVYWVASDTDHNNLFKDIAIGSTVYGFKLNIEEVIMNITSGTWQSGTRLYGIASTKPPGEYIDMVFNQSKLPSDVYDSMVKLRQDVIDAGGVGMLLPNENWWAPLAEYIPS